MTDWISVKDRLPDEHDSMFSKYFENGTANSTMWKKCSDMVIVSGVYPDGSKYVTTCKTHDGSWFVNSIFQMTITHWMPLPEPPKDGSDD